MQVTAAQGVRLVAVAEGWADAPYWRTACATRWDGVYDPGS